MSKSKVNSMSVATLGLFSAITVVLQILSYAIKIGTFNLSLVLIPIVLGAVMYGPKFGSILGGVFGVITLIASALGVDAGGNILFTASPIKTILICLIKGIAAGCVAGLIANALKEKHNYLAVILAAISAPIVNTGLFVIAMFIFFKDILATWAGGTNLLYYVIVGLVGINFIIEFFINA
ncbi:MAG: ECF transporter S component, partial [Clostridia bacterium]|nr:ECF transporter S component [Clostridia bacterium]